jgi:3-phenylpropionate/cinnamic acid dioxygenase small subunit
MDAQLAEEIRQVQVRYAEAIDGRNWALLADVFTKDAVLDAGDGSLRNGLGEIEEACRGVGKAFRATRHLLGNHEFITDGDTTSASCAFVVGLRHLDNAGTTTMWGRYEDDLHHTPDGWRIAARRAAVDWADTNPPAST